MSLFQHSRRVNPVMLSVLCLAVLMTGVWAAQEAAKSDLAAKLGKGDRYRTHVSTDKPIYRGGEMVYIRGVILDAINNKPLDPDAVAAAQIEIRGPKGDVVAKGALTSHNAVLGFSWLVPDGQPGGEYTIKVAYPWQGYAPAERKFDVRQYRAPRLKTQIVFVRDGYGPGDTVTASVNITRAEGGVPEGAKITAIARVDGKEAHRGAVEMDADGNASAKFDLPAKIERGEGTLLFVIEDGGVVETAAKTIPILLQTVDMGIYPESGYLVGNVPSRVYVESKTPWGKPADIKGVIEGMPAEGEDSKPFEVTRFSTFHEGRGNFTFTPEAGRAYRLRITQPAGMTKTYDLPKVMAKGAVIRATKTAYDNDEPITLSVAAAGVTPGEVVVSKVGRPLGRAAASNNKVRVRVPADVSGVLVATLYDDQGTPLAERLVYRKPARHVNIAITADKPRYTPGDPVTLTIKTTDDTGAPITSVVGLSVTDDSVLEMIDKREQAPRLPVMVMLGSDVRDLADAHVYLDQDNAKSQPALDLLLGTQGWRRFALVDVEQFKKNWGDDALRALAFRVPDPRRRGDMLIANGTRLKFLGDDESHLVFSGAVKSEGKKPGALQVVDARELKRNRAVEKFFDGAPVEAAAVPGRGGGEVDAAEGLPVPKAAPAVATNTAVADPQNVPDVNGPPVQMPQVAVNQKPADVAFKLDQPVGKIMAEREMDEAIEWNRGRRSQRMRNDFIIVREFSHAVRPDRQPGQRVDFTETLYFNAGVVTDAKTGTATVTFGLSDAVTSFRATADAFDQAGALGSHSELVESVQPFYIEPKMPLELTSGDIVQLPVAMVNATTESMDGVQLSIKTDEAINVITPTQTALAAGDRVRQIVTVNSRQFVGTTAFVVTANTGSLSDSNTRTLKVMPLGFPSGIAFGGMLEPGESASLTIDVPKDLVAHSMTTDIRVFPSPMANMTTAMERLIREPHGCFEQTSSTSYPLAMAQQYFTTHQGVDPALIDRAARTLSKGYQRLVSFQCPNRGYEWFGADPGHEALTAYGLMQFTDMSRTMKVDQEMIEHTRKWLLEQRDGEGNFKRARRALHTWIVDQDCSNGYILWALVSTGTDIGELKTELDAFEAASAKSSNSYVTALGALVMSEAGRADAAGKLRAKLAEQQADDGHIKGATTSIVGSRGNALNIETTALAQLALLQDKNYTSAVEGAHKWLAEQCEGGRYGSTQSTVLAIKAIVAYNEARATPRSPGKIVLLVDGKPVGEPIAFSTDDKEPFILPDIAKQLQPGEHTIEVKMEDGSTMPFALSVNYNRTQPDSADECKVRLTTSLKDTKLVEGNATEARVKISNISDEVAPTPIAIIGIPGGLEVRHDQLKELRDAGTIASYEVIGREVVLYWRELGAKKTVEFPLSLIAAVPGEFTAPASRAYQYYTDEYKQWTAPLKVKISAK